MAVTSQRPHQPADHVVAGTSEAHFDSHVPCPVDILVVFPVGLLCHCVSLRALMSAFDAYLGKRKTMTKLCPLRV